MIEVKNNNQILMTHDSSIEEHKMWLQINISYDVTYSYIYYNILGVIG